jgi:ABC-type proline/glycine betaine transport system substrate-binding protein
MALDADSTLADALDQYKANLAWWESSTKAANLLEAVLYMLACKPQQIAAADQTVTFAGLEQLRAELTPIAAAACRSSFVIGRAQGR